MVAQIQLQFLIMLNSRVNAILRPESLATDESTSSEVIEHFISEIEDDSDDFAILYLQPTSPLRNSSHIRSTKDF